MNNNPNISIIGLDIGDVRIGVARAGSIAKIPEPLSAIKNDSSLTKSLNSILKEYDAQLLVVGVPRNMNGQETEQSGKIRTLVEEIKPNLKKVEIVFVDESLSSVRADKYLQKTGGNFDQDSIAACYILEEYFTINR